eukprot:g4285.t1
MPSYLNHMHGSADGSCQINSLPAGYTRAFLDGQIAENEQIRTVQEAFGRISEAHDFTVVEGTGHCGVGSIVNLDNARVASLLGIDMVLVANGGIGSAFDQLELNILKAMQHGVNVKGVIMNKVIPDKLDMVRDYMGKALARYDIPLAGVIPYERCLHCYVVVSASRMTAMLEIVAGEALDSPSMYDYEQLFSTTLLGGADKRLNHYDNTEIVATGLRRFLEKLQSGNYNSTLFVTHGSRIDVILGFLSHAKVHRERTGEEFQGGMIVAGESPDRPGGGSPMESEHVMRAIETAGVPVMYVPHTAAKATHMMNKFVAKQNSADRLRIEAAITLYEAHIDFDVLLR